MDNRSCSKCGQRFQSRARPIQCRACHGWFHSRSCTGLPQSRMFYASQHGWDCWSCQQNPQVTAALQHLLAMGFTNDGGWLTQLAEAKEGNILAILDVLAPAKKSN